MNKKIGLIIAGVIVLLLVVTAVVVYKAVFSGSPTTSNGSPTATVTQASIPPTDSSIQVDLIKSTTAVNAVDINIKGMSSKMSGFEYELQYTSNGLVKGVTSGTTPVSVAGKDSISREIYLGTCSKGVCTPDPNVGGITLNLVFTDTSGKESQFSKDYTL